MKKQILITSALSLLMLTLVFTGCKKEEDTAYPTLTIIGANPYYMQLGEIWNDPGATASDQVDGTIDVIPSGTVTIGTLGTYVVTYTAMDEAGNSSSQTRTVQVVDVNGYYANVTDTSPYPGGTAQNYVDNMQLAADGSGKVTVTRFGNYTNASVYFNLTGSTTINVPAQNVMCGSPAQTINFSGNGTINYTAPNIVVDFTKVIGATITNSREIFSR